MRRRIEERKEYVLYLLNSNLKDESEIVVLYACTSFWPVLSAQDVRRRATHPRRLKAVLRHQCHWWTLSFCAAVALLSWSRLPVAKPEVARIHNLRAGTKPRLVPAEEQVNSMKVSDILEMHVDVTMSAFPEMAATFSGSSDGPVLVPVMLLHAGNRLLGPYKLDLHGTHQERKRYFMQLGSMMAQMLDADPQLVVTITEAWLISRDDPERKADLSGSSLQDVGDRKDFVVISVCRYDAVERQALLLIEREGGLPVRVVRTKEPGFAGGHDYLLDVWWKAFKQTRHVIGRANRMRFPRD